MPVKRQTSERQNTRVELIMLLLASLACVVVLTASLATSSGPSLTVGSFPAGTLALAALIGFTGLAAIYVLVKTLRTMRSDAEAAQTEARELRRTLAATEALI